LRQIRSYEKGGYPCYRIDAGCVLRGEETAEHIWNIVKMHPGENMLVYSSDSPEQVRKIQEEGKEKISFMLEQLTAELAARAAGSGYRRLIVAGGETSGAVIQRLGYQGFWIGHSIAPGVPVMVPLEDTRMRLVLKSGNFGQEDFFSRAVKELEGEIWISSQSVS
ncbi:nucleotide-binding domain containing protein, partial [Enterocloster sp.]|uniref:nucleotide-binding domain containing protein n=1 Tax=Enterocloster sp. TaxID=2719315 RepID=UPI0039A06F70